MTSFARRGLPDPDAALRNERSFEGSVRRVTYASEDDNFKVVTFELPDGRKFKAAGPLHGVRQGEPMRIEGTWREHPKYGWTLQVEKAVPVPPSTEDALVAYLGSGLVRGVGPVRARAIVDHFGERTLEILDEAPETLQEVKGISRKRARQIAESLTAQRQSREAMLTLKSLGLSNAISARLLRHYGEGVVGLLRENPYRAGLEVPWVGFFKADEIAANFGIARDSPHRLQASFVHVLDQAASEGHTHLPLEELMERAAKLLKLEDGEAVLREQLEAAIRARHVVRAKVGGQAEGYFMASLFHCERQLASMTLELVRQGKPLMPADQVDRAIARFEGRFRFGLAAQQREALRSVAGGGVCVLTGGPGTGKTTLVRAIMHLFGSMREVALCSPTGRAAQRLSEAAGREALTIHRLLKWNSERGRFQHDAKTPMETELLVVDEASMLDVQLAWALLRALKPGSTVVLVGDVDQLPSVGPGAFLRDLIASRRARTTRLEAVFRQARQSLIVQNSHRINEGTLPLLEGQFEEGADFYLVPKREPEDIADALLALLTERIPQRFGLDPIEDVQVLAPMRRGAVGTQVLNALLRERLNPDGAPLGPTIPFRAGDKVIQSSNNYDLDVYNGDVGRVLGMNRETGQVRVRFGKRLVLYPIESLSDLEPAYAITIHKSQGSEYPAVVVLLHKSHYIMLQRNLLYTAVTRGKKLVVVLGNRSAVNQAVRTVRERDRRTALAEWLLRPPEKGDLFE